MSPLPSYTQQKPKFKQQTLVVQSSSFRDNSFFPRLSICQRKSVTFKVAEGPRGFSDVQEAGRTDPCTLRGPPTSQHNNHKDLLNISQNKNIKLTSLQVCYFPLCLLPETFHGTIASKRPQTLPNIPPKHPETSPQKIKTIEYFYRSLGLPLRR